MKGSVSDKTSRRSAQSLRAASKCSSGVTFNLCGFEIDASLFPADPYYLNVWGIIAGRGNNQTPLWELILVFQNDAWTSARSYPEPRTAKRDMHLLAERQGWSVDGSFFLMGDSSEKQILMDHARLCLGYEPVFRMGPGVFPCLVSKGDDIPF